MNDNPFVFAPSYKHFESDDHLKSPLVKHSSLQARRSETVREEILIKKRKLLEEASNNSIAYQEIVSWKEQCKLLANQLASNHKQIVQLKKERTNAYKAKYELMNSSIGVLKDITKEQNSSHKSDRDLITKQKKILETECEKEKKELKKLQIEYQLMKNNYVYINTEKLAKMDLMQKLMLSISSNEEKMMATQGGLMHHRTSSIANNFSKSAVLNL